MSFAKRIRLVRAAALAAAIGLTLLGCSPDEGRSGAEPPAGYPRSWIWYAAPGISLQSAESKTVRGWAESHTLYQDAKVSYPGFVEATSPDLLRDLVGANDPSKGGGTERYLIRSIAVSSGELRASLCVDGWNEFGFQADGRLLDASPAIVVRQLVMRKKGAESAGATGGAKQAFVAAMAATPTPNPVGRLPYESWLKGPAENVFGDWTAVSYAVDVVPPADCLAWFKKNHPGLHSPPDYTLEQRPRPSIAPPPTLPASPGW